MKTCPIGCGVAHLPEARFCGLCGRELVNQDGPLEMTYYLHSSKEDNYASGKDLGLTGTALDTFEYTCYELSLHLQVDPDTGRAEVVGIFEGQDLVPLARKVKV